MASILEVRRWPDVRETFSWDALWPLFEGDRARLNLAHECVDRHAGGGVALRLATADGRFVEHSFAELAQWSSRFANLLEAEGIAAGERVAIMLEPSLAFYGALFGAVKRGAVAVPLFTLFGPDAVALRVDDCRPRLLLVERDVERWQSRVPGLDVVALDARFAARLAEQSDVYTARTAADDPAVFQYTSGTTRALPEAVRHTHRAVVTLMVAALYGVGLEPGDRFFCPSSPAWGHGLWHGTIAPLALGIPVGTLAGRFDPARFAAALDTFAITNVAAAPTVYRMARGAGWTPARGRIAKCSFTGEPMDGATREFLSGALPAACTAARRSASCWSTILASTGMTCDRERSARRHPAGTSRSSTTPESPSRRAGWARSPCAGAERGFRSRTAAGWTPTATCTTRVARTT